MALVSELYFVSNLNLVFLWTKVLGRGRSCMVLKDAAFPEVLWRELSDPTDLPRLSPALPSGKMGSGVCASWVA